MGDGEEIRGDKVKQRSVFESLLHSIAVGQDVYDIARGVVNYVQRPARGIKLYIRVILDFVATNGTTRTSRACAV